ncbi:hypothetical protein RJ55_08524 [Drechmeria coniospora]|nr:hypothetical protein RJ55_08524 [Drechmeria coniospora]
MKLLNAFILATVASAATVLPSAIAANGKLQAIEKTLDDANSTVTAITTEIQNFAGNLDLLIKSYHELDLSLRRGMRAITNLAGTLSSKESVRVVGLILPFQNIPASLQAVLRTKVDVIAEARACYVFDKIICQMQDHFVGVVFNMKLFSTGYTPDEINTLHTLGVYDTNGKDILSSQRNRFQTAMEEITVEFWTSCTNYAAL